METRRGIVDVTVRAAERLGAQGSVGEALERAARAVKPEPSICAVCDRPVGLIDTVMVVVCDRCSSVGMLRPMRDGSKPWERMTLLEMNRVRAKYAAVTGRT